jgi:uncharacterized membrane protein
MAILMSLFQIFSLSLFFPYFLWLEHCLAESVETRKIYRTEIRTEESKRKHEERDKIINAQSYNKKIFYQMIRKQRTNKNIIVEDLYVGNTLYEGDRFGFPLLSTVYELICFVLWLL